MLRTAELPPPTRLLTLGSDPTRFQTEPPACYRASWQLPGRDSHPLATMSLCWIRPSTSTTSNSGRTTVIELAPAQHRLLLTWESGSLVARFKLSAADRPLGKRGPRAGPRVSGAADCAERTILAIDQAVDAATATVGHSDHAVRRVADDRSVAKESCGCAGSS